jgi:hypothetical protein
MISGARNCQPAPIHSRQRQKHTIQQLINQDKVVLHSLLVELAKVTAAQLDQAVEKLEDEGGIGVALGDSNQVDILVLDMAKGGAAKGQDGRADLGVADDLDAEDIGKARTAVVAKRPEDQVLALLVEDEDAGQHFGGGLWSRRGVWSTRRGQMKRPGWIEVGVGGAGADVGVWPGQGGSVRQNSIAVRKLGSRVVGVGR